MERLTLDRLDAEASRFDAAVAVTVGIDRFCSSSLWVMPAATALTPPRAPWIWRTPTGYLALMAGTHDEGWRFVQPLEAAWGLACPLVGADAALLAHELLDVLRAQEERWDLLLLSGLPRGPLLDGIVTNLAPRYLLRAGPITRRHVASLEGGLDGFLSRRSHSFRKGLRRTRARAVAAGLTFETARGHPDQLYERLLAVERCSWKARQGSGLAVAEMRAFYRDMLRRMAAVGAARLMFARQAERDVGYILGGVFAGTYRGLQFSFDDDFRDLGPGVLCQLAQIEALCAEGIRTYDLGTEMEYKQRWGEIAFDTLTVIAQR